MAIGLYKNTTIKPPPSSRPNSDPLSLPTLVPLTIFDKAAFDLHVAVLYAFRPPMPSNEVMKEALSKVLEYFPHLAGRFTTDGNGKTCIVLNSAGVRVTETYLPTTLSEQLPFEPSKEVNHLLPPVEGVEEYLLLIQLNRYACGGLVIGQAAHHRVSDGQSMSAFFDAWAKLVRGLNVDPLPYHDRLGITAPRNPPIVEFDHHSIEFKKTDDVPDTPVPLSSIENLSINFSNEFINKLRAKVVDKNENQTGCHRYTTFECLLAHVWKKATRARESHYDEWTQVRVAVNGRARMKPPVPMEFFGNLVLWAYPKLMVREVLHESYAYVAKAIHDAVTKVDHRYFQSFIDFGKVTSGEEKELDATAPEIGNTLCPNLEADSWMRFQFHELDFGGGGPCAFYPSNLPVEGLFIFLPSCQEGGGVDVVMSLLPRHVLQFKKISHSLE
ncbi:hypothetical protein Syun_010046 [Stephania yunnanensis]|uniref:Uncharacterized protein n=1 Tax=Stephania yunnanensis TaxID=152371 RepID=A0AAP0KFU1_9MAGN